MRRDDWLLHQLPVGMVEDDFLGRFLSIFQDVADTVVGQIDNLPHVFDPTVAPPSMVRTLGRWIGLDWVDPSLPGRAAATDRARVLRAAALARARSRGMRQLLELISGGPAIVEETGGVYAEGEAPADIGHVLLERRDVGMGHRRRPPAHRASRAAGVGDVRAVRRRPPDLAAEPEHPDLAVLEEVPR